jgi:excisionase family DNA binding protein
MQTTKAYTVEQVAKVLQVKKGFIYDLIYTGRLRAVRLSERRFRITEEALQDFFRQEEEVHAENISAYSSLRSAKEVD